MAIYSPSDSLMADYLARISYRQGGPKYIRLDRTGYPLIYKKDKEIDISKGFSLLKKGKELYIIATGRMVYNALSITEILSHQSIDAGIIDLFKIKPFEKEAFWSVIKTARYIVTLEEHFITGGIGSIIAEVLITQKEKIAFKSIGIPHQFCRQYGTREYLQRINKIDTVSVAASIIKWIKSPESK